MADSIILMILALVVFGPRKLPQIGRQIGRLMYEFRKASNDFKFQMEEELRLAEDAERRKKEEEQRQKALTEQAGVSAQPAAVAAEAIVDPTVADLTVSSSASVAESVPEVHVPRIAGPVSSEPVTAETAAEHVSSGSGELVIQPPSTGETVAAARPGAVVAEEVTQSAGMESGTETVTQNG